MIKEVKRCLTYDSVVHIKLFFSLENYTCLWIWVYHTPLQILVIVFTTESQSRVVGKCATAHFQLKLAECL